MRLRGANLIGNPLWEESTTRIADSKHALVDLDMGLLFGGLPRPGAHCASQPEFATAFYVASVCKN